MSRLLRRFGASCAALALFAIACRDQAVTGPGLPRHTAISVSPRFSVGAESAEPISRIHTVVREVDVEGQPIEQAPLVDQSDDVDSTAASWRQTLDFTISAPVRVIVEMELIYVGQGEPTSIEWAARIGPLTIAPGSTKTVNGVDLGRGPLFNLPVTSVSIGEYPSLIFVGDGASLSSSYQPDISAQVFWGSLDPTVASIDQNGHLTALAAGTARITATAGFQSDTVNITVADPTSIVSFLGAEAGDGQSATVGTAVAVRPAVRAFDSGERSVRGVPITFTVTGGGGSITGPATIVTDASGVATLGGWTLGTTAGPNTITASVAGRTITTTITATGTPAAAANVVVVSGSGQSGSSGTALAQPIVARVRDQFNNSVPGVTVTFAASGGGTVNPATAVTDASGLAQATWTPGLTGTTQSATATAAGVATPATFSATVTLPPPQVQLALAGADKVSLNRTQVVNVTLPTPAPAGGASITVTSSAPSVLAVQGGTLTIAAGQTQGTVGVSGLVEGNATLTATSPQYQTGTLATSVELRVLGLPTTINVPYGQTASLPINIPRPAPAGGITVSISTSDPTRVGLASGTAVIPAGAVTGVVTLNGVLPGPATIIASHPLYDPDTTAATTTAALDILNTTYSINTSFGATTPVRFLSNNVPVPAPTPGVDVTLISRTPSCVTVPATVRIPTGLTETSFTMTYNAQGGTTTFPCTSRVVASSSAGIAIDSTTVTVAAQPGISVTTASVGQGLQRGWTAVLGASNHGGATVRITSPDPQMLLIAPDANTPGSPFIDVTILNGSTQANFYVQALDAARPAAYAITASATGFTTGTGNATVVTPAVEIGGVNTSTTSLTGNDDFFVRIGIPGSNNQFMQEYQDRRAGGAPLVATATVSDPAVLQVVSQPGTGTSGTTQVTAGNSNSPTTFASGGVALKPIGNGTASVTASIPGFVTTSSGTVTVTVTTPGITANGATVGAGLQRAMSASLGAAAPTGGATVRVTSTDPNVLLVSPNGTTAGTPFIDVVMAAGQSTISYYAQGVNGQTGSPAVTFASPGYAAGRATVPVVTPGIELGGLNSSTTTLSGDDAFFTRIGIPGSQNQFMQEYQDVRAGGTTFTFTIVSDTPSVASLVSSTGAVGNSAQVSIAPGQSNSPTTLSAAGGVALRPLTAGTTRVSTSAPGTVALAAGAQVVTVTQPTQFLNAATVGAGLQRSISGSVGAAAHGGVTVHLASSDPAKLRLAKDATSASAATLDIVLPNNTNSFTYYLHGMEGQTGAVTVTATTPGFANGSATMNVVAPFIELGGLNATTTTLSVNDDFFTRIGIPGSNNQFMQEYQDVRFGGTPVTVSFATSAPGVAQLVPSTTNGTTATATIGIGQSNSPTTVAAGGVALDPLTAGTTTITMTSSQATPTTSGGSATVTVSAPTLSFNASTVGAGLQRFASLSMSAPAPAGGITVRLTSSQPSVLLLSPNATTAGTDFLDVAVPAGSSSLSFYVQGVDGQTGTPTISAKAPGFADGTAAQPVVAPAIELSGVPTSIVASAADDPFFARIGIPGTNNQFMQEYQDRRAGQPALTVTFTNSNATSAQLANSTTRAQSLTSTIVPGQSNTPTTVATGGVAFDPLAAGSTNVSASIAGFVMTINGGTVTVNVQAGLLQAAARNLVGTR